MRSRARCICVLLGKHEETHAFPNALACLLAFECFSEVAQSRLAVCACPAATGNSGPERGDDRVCREAKGGVETRVSTRKRGRREKHKYKNQSRHPAFNFTLWSGPVRSTTNVPPLLFTTHSVHSVRLSPIADKAKHTQSDMSLNLAPPPLFFFLLLLDVSTTSCLVLPPRVPRKPLFRRAPMERWG